MVKIRKSTDAETIQKLNLIFFPETPLSEDALDNSVWWIAYDDDTEVGFGGLYTGIQGQRWLVRVGVARTHRRLGLGWRLLEKRVAYWRKHHPKCALYTYCACWNTGSVKNILRAKLIPYRVEDNEWLYFWRPAHTHTSSGSY